MRTDRNQGNRSARRKTLFGYADKRACFSGTGQYQQNIAFPNCRGDSFTYDKYLSAQMHEPHGKGAAHKARPACAGHKQAGRCRYQLKKPFILTLFHPVQVIGKLIDNGTGQTIGWMDIRCQSYS